MPRHPLRIIFATLSLAWLFGVLSPDGVRLLFEYHSKEDCVEERGTFLEMLGSHKGWVVSECINTDKKA